MIDGNTAALRAYEDKVSASEQAFEQFNKDIDSCLAEIQEQVEAIKAVASHYEEQGYDFYDEIDELIKEVL